MLFRILVQLTKGGGPGDLTRLEWLTPDQQQVLVDGGAVAPVSAPPLAELGGWQRRSARLEALGITMLGEFIEANNEDLAAKLRVKPSTIQRWKKEAMGWLVARKPVKKGD